MAVNRTRMSAAAAAATPKRVIRPIPPYGEAPDAIWRAIDTATKAWDWRATRPRSPIEGSRILGWRLSIGLPAQGE